MGVYTVFNLETGRGLRSFLADNPDQVLAQSMGWPEIVVEGDYPVADYYWGPDAEPVERPTQAPFRETTLQVGELLTFPLPAGVVISYEVGPNGNRERVQADDQLFEFISDKPGRFGFAFVGPFPYREDDWPLTIEVVA